MDRHGSSLKLRLIVGMMLTTLVGLVVALGAMIAYDLHAFHRGWTSDIVAKADLLARTTAPALAFNDPRVATENLHFLHLTNVRAAAIYMPSGALFASYTSEGNGAAALPKIPGAEGMVVEGTRMTVTRHIIENGDILGTIYLQSDYLLFQHLATYLGIAGLVLAFAMLVAYLVSVWLQRIVTAPIISIADVARDVVEQRNYARRARKTSDDEVGMLVDAFNNMLSEIERRTGELEVSNNDKAREVDERRQAQQEVTRLNHELESRVQERTLQLEASNSELALAKHAAESANRAKSEFLSSMSHELRTPLNAIIGFGQLLTSSELATSDEQKRVFTEHIVKAGRHLLELINEILNLAQIEAGKLTLSLEPVELDDVLLDCQTMIAPMCEERGIHLLFPPSQSMRVKADRMRLKQVLLNLLSNAVKYNRDGGSVVVECCLQADGHVRTAVQDTGMGLNDAQLSQLFQPFHRLGQEAGKVEGTGIGLVVTKHLVELMGGTIGVKSTVGSGTVFWVDLPDAGARTPVSPPQMPGIAQAETAHASPPALTRPAATPAQDVEPCATVLYVEDNAASLKLVQEMLSFRKDLRLLSAPEARLGIALARVHKPDVILMDNNMPGMTGSQALAVLKSDPLTAHIRVIALTANAMPQSIESGLRMGFFRYLTKPVDMQALTEAIDDALRSGA